MNKIKTLKKISLIIFMLIILPYGKLVILNGFMIIINIGFMFTEAGLSFLGYIFILICLLGIYFIYFKKNYYVIFGFFLTYIWLIYKIDYKELINNFPISISVFIYALISIYTSIKILKEPKSQK